MIRVNTNKKDMQCDYVLWLQTISGCNLRETTELTGLDLAPLNLTQSELDLHSRFEPFIFKVTRHSER